MKEKFILMLIALILAIPMSGQNSQTKRVAILETVDKEGQMPYGVKLMVRSKLCDFITATPGYEGYDRVDVSSILSEHKFQRSGLVSDSDIKRLGEMTGANYVLVAEAAYLNSSHIVLTAKIINVETARVEQTATVQSPTTVEGLEANCKDLAGKLLNINAETGAFKGELDLGYGRYVGEYVNGKPHGKGIIYYSSDDKRKSYEGEWSYGNISGNGVMIWKDGTKYSGYWSSGTFNGRGSLYYSNGDTYIGEWLNGKKHGKGKMIYSSDDANKRKCYDGDWRDDCQRGIGTMIWNDGQMFTGGWRDNKFHGKGEFTYSFGVKNIGTWQNGMKYGEFKVIYPWGYETGDYWNDIQANYWNRYVRQSNGTLKKTMLQLYKNGRVKKTISY